MFVCLIRTVILYFLLVLTIRLMGKRQLGEMEPSEFVVTLLIADLASVPMQDLGIPLLSGVVPILTLLITELLLSTFSYYFIGIRKLLCGRPVILMENGVILQENLKKTRITPDELTEHLREKDILDLSKVKFAILETNGQISAFPFEQHQPLTPHDMNIEPDQTDLPVTIISSGKLLRHNLSISGFDEQWLQKVLRKHKCSVGQVYLLTVNSAGQTYFAEKKEEV